MTINRSVSTSIYARVDLLERIEAKAKEEGKTVSLLFTEAATEKLNREDPIMPVTEDTKTKKRGGLVLTRFAGDTFYIGEDIMVKVVTVHGGRVSIWIDAPRDMPIVRGEHWKGR